MPWQEVQICVHDVHETHFAGSIINKRTDGTFKIINGLFRLFFIYFIQNAVLRRKKSSSGQGRSESKKKNFFFFLGSGPKIGSVGTWETDNQLDVPLYQ